MHESLLNLSIVVYFNELNDKIRYIFYNFTKTVKYMRKAVIISSLVLIMSLSDAVAQNDFTARYDDVEINIGDLPDPLMFSGGKRVKNARQWVRRRRGEILEIYAQEMYGHIPERPEGLHFRTLAQEPVYDGLGIRKTVRIYLDSREDHWFDVMIHLPAKADGPVPMFVGLNFKGNAATLDERADFRWPYEMILKAGMGVATAWRDTIEPDGRDCNIDDEDVCRDGGVRSWYNKGGDWGAISAWAWGLSRIMDYLETDKAADCSKVAVIGHSRLGKTALWAGANDLRFDMVISNDSGCCGAALSRRVYGENFAIIANAFPHWFTSEFRKYMWNEDGFPADQLRARYMLQVLLRISGLIRKANGCPLTLHQKYMLFSVLMAWVKICLARILRISWVMWDIISGPDLIIFLPTTGSSICHLLINISKTYET